jgi:hypothetical protein
VGGRADADVAPPAVPLREWLSQFDALGAESIMRAQGYTTVKELVNDNLNDVDLERLGVRKMRARKTMLPAMQEIRMGATQGEAILSDPAAVAAGEAAAAAATKEAQEEQAASRTRARLIKQSFGGPAFLGAAAPTQTRRDQSEKRASGSLVSDEAATKRVKRGNGTDDDMKNFYLMEGCDTSADAKRFQSAARSALQAVKHCVTLDCLPAPSFVGRTPLEGQPAEYTRRIGVALTKENKGRFAYLDVEGNSQWLEDPWLTTQRIEQLQQENLELRAAVTRQRVDAQILDSLAAMGFSTSDIPASASRTMQLLLTEQADVRFQRGGFEAPLFLRFLVMENWQVGQHGHHDWVLLRVREEDHDKIWPCNVVILLGRHRMDRGTEGGGKFEATEEEQPFELIQLGALPTAAG